jgi:hypothetical protein
MDGYLSHSHPESDERQQQLSTCSDEPRNIIEQLAPAGRDDFRRELTSCLALCAPSGMTQDDRNEWLRVAWGTLSHLPADMLNHACSVARREADHPSKIVPIITRETGDWMRNRRAAYGSIPAPVERLSAPDYCTADQAASILREFGLGSSLRNSEKPNPQS